MRFRAAALLNRFASLNTVGAPFLEETSVECSLATQLAVTSRVRSARRGARGGGSCSVSDSAPTLWTW